MFSKFLKFFFGKQKARSELSKTASETSFSAGETFEPNQNEEVGRFSLGDFPIGSYPADWDARRRKALDRDDGHCQVNGCINCRSWGDSPLHVHHKIAVGVGGSHDFENLITLCEFHHGLLHFTNQLLKEEIRSARFSLIRPYWRRGRWSAERHEVRAAVRRFQLVTGEDLGRMREHYGLVCGMCGSDNWRGSFIYKRKGSIRHPLVETKCSNCNDRWLFERGLIEETGFQIASAFKATKSLGKFNFDPNLIVGLDEPQHFDGCPECQRHDRNGFLVRKEGTNGAFFGCSEWQRGQGCNYTRPIKK